MKKIEGSSVDAFTDDNDTLQAIAFQTEEMRNTFAAYPELLLIDATYKLNNLRMPLYVLMNVDGNGESEVICLWLVATEDRLTISLLMDKFKERNPNWVEIGVIMADKDMTERDVLTEKLPGAEILICLFHALRSFRREITTEKLGISIGERNLSLELLGKMSHAVSEEQYQNLCEDLKRSAPRCVVEYFNRNWHDIREQWVEGLKNTKANLMNNTNNRLESTNQKLKSVISRYSGVTVFFQDLMKCINTLKNERDHRATNVTVKIPIHRRVLSQPEKEYENLLTPFAFGYLQDQFKFSQETTIVGTVDEKSATVKTNTLGNIVVSIDTCQCSFFTSILLPCRHIIAVRRHLNFPLFDESLCATRWTVHYYKSRHRVYQQPASSRPDFSNDEDGSITLTNLQPCEKTRAVLSEQQKYNKAYFLLMSIAQIMSEQGMRDYEHNFQVLQSLKVYLQERKKVILTELVVEADAMVPDSGVCDVLDVEQLPPNCQIIPVVLPKVTTSMTFTVDATTGTCSKPLPSPRPQTPSIDLIEPIRSSSFSFPSILQEVDMNRNMDATTGTCSKPLPSPRPQTPSIDLIEPSRSSSLSFPSILQEVDMNRNMEATTRTCSKPLPSPRPQTPSIDLIEPIRSSSLSFPSILQEVDMNRNTDGGNPSPTIQLVPSSFKSVNAPLPVSTSILKEVDVKKNGFPMDISMVKMPPKQKKRGRPKGAGTTVIGLPLKKTKKSSKAFRMKSETEKSAIMMSWFIDDKIAETCLRSDVLVQPNHVKVPERIPMKCLDENIAINTIRKYFSFDAWKMVEEAMKTMQTKGTWLCKRCCGCLDAFESIGCDACLEWYHMKCLAMKSRPKQKFWICRDC